MNKKQQRPFLNVTTFLLVWGITAGTTSSMVKAEDQPTTPPSRGLLASALMSDKFAADTSLDVRGWVSGGGTWNTTNSSNSDFNGPITYNDHADTAQLDQAYFIGERKVTYGADDYSLGGRVDVAYGSDGPFMQSAGFDNHFNGNSNPRNQLAIPQAYVEANLPVGNGLSVKAGHFYTLLGYEVPTAPDNFFYSHSYAMQYAEPVTHWGALATYTLSDTLTVSGGAVRGWDNLSDTADENLSFLGGTTWKASDDTTVVFSLISGNQGRDQNLTAYSLVLTHLIDKEWSYVLQHDFGSYDVTAGRQNWYTLSNYLMYQLTDATKLGVRLEWFDDADGSRVTGFRSVSELQDSNYFALTLGASTKLTDYLTFRPEVRYDWQTESDAGKHAFDNGSDRNQLLVSGNLILGF